MPSETFYCPQCKRQLTKSAQAYVLGEVLTSKKSSFVALGSIADTVTCPGCGTSIDARKMVLGEYDAMKIGKGLGIVFSVLGWAIIIGVVAIVLYVVVQLVSH